MSKLVLLLLQFQKRVALDIYWQSILDQPWVWKVVMAEIWLLIHHIMHQALLLLLNHQVRLISASTHTTSSTSKHWNNNSSLDYIKMKNIIINDVIIEWKAAQIFHFWLKNLWITMLSSRKQWLKSRDPIWT